MQGLHNCAKTYAIAYSRAAILKLNHAIAWLPHNSVPENIMGSYCTPNFDLKQLLNHALTPSQVEPQNHPN